MRSGNCFKGSSIYFSLKNTFKGYTVYFRTFIFALSGIIKQALSMTHAEFQSYRFDACHEPSDEQLGQLMENAAKKVRESNHEADEKFFAELRCASNEAKKRITIQFDTK